MRRRTALMTVLCLAFGGCAGYEKVERETGYRGPARLDPFLAAGRFLAGLGYDVRRERRWPAPDAGHALLVMPAAMIEGRGSVMELRRWVGRGGHLVCLVEQASAAHSDWSRITAPEVPPPDALVEWLADIGWRRIEGAERPEQGAHEEWRVGAESFEINRPGRPCLVPEDAGAGQAQGGGEAGAGRSFFTVGYGQGRLTLLADARPLRNRYLGEADHALLLSALARASRDGAVVFVVGSGISFWGLLWQHGWPALLALAGLVAVWLWRTVPRFGPVRVDTRLNDWRDYRRHLEAVGLFLWRHDRGASLLEPLRREVLDRLQRRRAAAGVDDEGVFSLAESISGVPAARVRQALQSGGRPDPAAFTRITSDLQQLLRSI